MGWYRGKANTCAWRELLINMFMIKSFPLYSFQEPVLSYLSCMIIPGGRQPDSPRGRNPMESWDVARPSRNRPLRIRLWGPFRSPKDKEEATGSPHSDPGGVRCALISWVSMGRRRFATGSSWIPSPASGWPRAPSAPAPPTSPAGWRPSGPLIPSPAPPWKPPAAGKPLSSRPSGPRASPFAWPTPNGSVASGRPWVGPRPIASWWPACCVCST